MTLRAVRRRSPINVREDLELAAELPENSLRLLLRAARYAHSAHPSDQFAVSLRELRASGLAECDIHWLSLQGYIAATSPGRAAVLTGKHAVRSPAFVLTERGQRLVEQLLAQLAFRETCEPLIEAQVSGPAREDAVGRVPCWDSQRRVLSLGQVVVKRFCVPAENQEIILSSFQEEAWPEHLDDPLPPAAGIDAKRRLHSTIQCLNRNQKAPLLRFHGDGYGRGIRWERLSAGPQLGDYSHSQCATGGPV